MALPVSYKCANLYMNDCLELLKDYQWIYNYPNTHILTNKVFDQIPNEWTEYFENFNWKDFNNLAAGCVNDTAPDTLKDFVSKLNKLKPSHEVHFDPTPFQFPKNISIGSKKRHEITCLSSLIHRICEENHISNVLDIGCGLGYLDHVLNSKFKYKITGLEGDAEKVKLAEKFQNKYYPNSTEDIKYFHHFISKNSTEKIKELIQTDTCIIGLHACADLSPTILELFSEIPSAKCMVIMSCCYHRLYLKQQHDGSEEFENFPYSDTLKSLFETFEGKTFLKRPFLRLAAQQSCRNLMEMDDKDHDVHAKNVLYRAILQEIVDEGGYQIHRLKRKSGLRPKSGNSNVENYIENLPTSYRFSKNNLPVDYAEIRTAFMTKWSLSGGKSALAEALSSLQASIQALCENLVLLDRAEFLNGKGVSASVYKVTDERLSPRCYALVATKQ